MKNLFYIAFLLTLLLGAACDAEHTSEEKKAPPANNHLLIFVDKTLSLDSRQFEKALGAHLPSVLKQHIRTRGDRVRVVYVHGNTGGDAYAYEATFNDALPDTTQMGAASREEARDDYDKQLRRFRRQCLQEVRKAMETTNETRSARHTDLWRSLVQIKNYFEGVPPTDDQIVIFFSDMVESMPGKGRRDFHKKPLKTQEITDVVRTDTEHIERLMPIQRDAFSDLQVRIFFPEVAFTQSQHQTMFDYWEGIFRYFGLQRPIIRN